MNVRRGSWVAAVLVTIIASPAAASTLPIPAPVQPILLPGVGATADRLRVSVLPRGATADDRETVAVRLDGVGSPQAVTVDQRIVLTGHGDYVVVERGPARRAEVLGDGDPPTLKAGAVIYAGFLPPAGRLLAAHLTLDPAYEQARLPLAVRLSFHLHGVAEGAPLGAGGRVDGPGVVELTLIDNAATVAPVNAADAPAAMTAGPLDALRDAAAAPGERPPVAGVGLPARIVATGHVDQSNINVPVPLALSGHLTEVDARGHVVPGATVTGPGTTSTGGIAGVLADTTTVRITVPRAGVIKLDLHAVPALDPRNLVPPAGAETWAAWAATTPSEPARRAAVDELEFVAAESAQLRNISPYLTTGLAGVVNTSFDYRLEATSALSRQVSKGLVARPFGIAMIVLAALLVIINLEFLRRRL